MGALPDSSRVENRFHYSRSIKRQFDRAEEGPDGAAGNWVALTISIGLVRCRMDLRSVLRLIDEQGLA